MLIGVTLTAVIAAPGRRSISGQNGLSVVLASTQLSTSRCSGTTLIASLILICHQSTDIARPGIARGVITAPAVQLIDVSSESPLLPPVMMFLATPANGSVKPAGMPS